KTSEPGSLACGRKTSSTSISGISDGASEGDAAMGRSDAELVNIPGLACRGEAGCSGAAAAGETTSGAAISSDCNVCRSTSSAALRSEMPADDGNARPDASDDSRKSPEC